MSEPMVLPSVDVVCALIGDYNALPEFEKKRKATTIESYMNEKIRKAQEQLEKSRTKIMERERDQLMMQLHGDRSIADLNVNEIKTLLSFSKDKILESRKRLDSVEHIPLLDPPMHLFETQPEELRTTTNDVPVIGGGQPMQYPYDDVMSREEINVNIGSSQFHWSSNSMMTNDGLRQEPQPPNEATAGEGNADATSFDTNRDWPGINNHHF